MDLFREARRELPSVQDFVRLHPTTATWFALVAMTTVATLYQPHLKKELSLNWKRVAEEGEWWRLLTSLCCVGGSLLHGAEALIMLKTNLPFFERERLRGRWSFPIFLFAAASLVLLLDMGSLRYREQYPLLCAHTRRKSPYCNPFPFHDLAWIVLCVSCWWDPLKRTAVNLMGVRIGQLGEVPQRYMPFLFVMLHVVLGRTQHAKRQTGLVALSMPFFWAVRSVLGRGEEDRETLPPPPPPPAGNAGADGDNAGADGDTDGHAGDGGEGEEDRSRWLQEVWPPVVGSKVLRRGGLCEVVAVDHGTAPETFVVRLLQQYDEEEEGGGEVKDDAVQQDEMATAVVHTELEHLTPFFPPPPPAAAAAAAPVGGGAGGGSEEGLRQRIPQLR